MNPARTAYALAHFPQIAHCAFPGREQHIADVRTWLRDVVGDYPDLITCATELATNAVRYTHSRGATFSVVVGWDVESIQCHVLDDGPLPEPPADPGRDGGRGLFIVQALSAASGAETLPAGGRISWFRLTLTEETV